MSPKDKPLVWLSEKVETPPLSQDVRIEAGFLLRKLQRGELIAMPHSRPMPSIGSRCHELRITGESTIWRIVYRIDNDAIIIIKVFNKKTQQTPKHIIEICKKRLKEFDQFIADE